MTWNFNRFIDEIDFLANLLSRRMDYIKNFLDLSPLVKRLNVDMAKKSILNLFKNNSINVLGIDGSMSHEERMEIIVLYISVSGFRTCVNIKDDGSINVNLNEISREEKYTFSTVIPIWIEDINEILKLREIGGFRSLEVVMESIPFSIMTFGEYYMGLKSIRGDIDMLILDRPIASSIHPYRRDARRLIFEDGGGNLHGLKINNKVIDIADLYLGVYAGPFINNKPLFKMPYRGRFKLHAIIQYLIECGGSADWREISKVFTDIKAKNWNRLLKKFLSLNHYLNGTLLYDESLRYMLEIRKERLNYWDKLIELIDYVGNRLFYDGMVEHPLYLDEGKWISTRELNVITLLTIYELGRIERAENKLIIGIGKDTYVTDLYRSAIPLAQYLGMINKDMKIPIKSDRPLLTLASSIHPKIYRTPWRFSGYDGALATLIVNKADYEERVPLKAARKVIYPEGIIVRNYFQLRSYKGVTDVDVKAPIFFYDRFQREADKENIIKINALEGGSVVTLNIYYEKDINPIDNMILYILSNLDNPEITEATGHNYLLFMADKDVKATINTVKDMIMDVADARINRVIRDRGIFVITRRFRDYRRLIERRRRI